MSEDQLSKLMSMLGIGAGAAGIGSGLYNIFGKGPNLSGEAGKYLNQIPGAMKPYYEPYMGAGRSALDQLMGQYGQLTGSTGDVYNKLAGGYQQSPGFQQALNKAMGAVSNQAAAGGMLGSPAAQVKSADIAGDLAQKDFGDYMSRMMGLYKTGLSGLGDVNQMGYGASTDYGNMLANILGQKGQYGVLDKTMQNQRRGQGFGQLAGGLGSLAGGLLFGPLGGGAGGAAGHWLSGLFGGK